MGFFSKLLSVGESKPLKNYQRRVAEVNAFEPAMQARSDEELAHLTVEFRERLANGEDLDDLLPEAFAAVREASGAHYWSSSFRRSAHWRHGVERWQNR